MVQILKSFARDETAATAVEYGLILALISAAIIGGATTIGIRLNTAFQAPADHL